MTEEITVLTKRCIDALAGRCDMAVRQDGVGFNGYDAQRGHRLAALPVTDWTENDARAAIKMIQKYREQLKALGLTVPEAPKETKAVNVKLEDGKYIISFGYAKDVVEALKRTLRDRRFNSSTRSWEAGLGEYENIKTFLVAVGQAEDAAYLPTPNSRDLEAEKKNANRIEDGGDHYKVFFRYKADLVNKIKGVVGRRFVGRDRTSEPHWTVPKTSVAMLGLLPLIKDNGFYADQKTLAEIEAGYTKGENNIDQSKAAVGEPLVIDGLKGELYPFQKAAVRYIQANKRVIIADEPGLGKTVEAIASAHSMDAYPAVVVCPASLKLNWKREADRWLDKTSVIWDTKHQKEADIVILNYDIVHKINDKILELDPKAVIIDESHYVKNRKSKRAEAVRDIAKGREVVIELTGTPVMNRAEELINQLSILGRLEDMGGAWTILNRYCWAPNRAEEFNRNLRATCFIRREKSTVLSELPAKRRVVIPVSVNLGEYNRKKKEVVEYIAAKMKEDGELMAALERAATKEEKKVIIKEHRKTARSLSALLPEIEELKQIAAKAKMPAVIEWIKSFLETEKKLVIFAHHHSVVEVIAHAFNVPYINQGTPLKERQRIVDDFQTNPNTRLIVGTLGTMGVGLTLTAASDVLVVELGWNAAQMDQAEDRIHRIGQKGAATAWYIITEGTIENELMQMIEQKRALATEITEGQESQSNAEALTRILEALVGEE